MSANVVNAAAATVSAIAAAVAVIAAIKTGQTDSSLKEKMEAINSVDHWITSMNSSGGMCAAMLAQFSAHDFNEFANGARRNLEESQRPLIARCAVGYDRTKFGTFDADGDLVLNEDEREHLRTQVINNLIHYETLASKFAVFGPDAQADVCKQACMPANSPYRHFQRAAAGSKWWNYPRLDDFMKSCKTC